MSCYAFSDQIGPGRKESLKKGSSMYFFKHRISEKRPLVTDSCIMSNYNKLNHKKQLQSKYCDRCCG